MENFSQGSSFGGAQEDERFAISAASQSFLIQLEAEDFGIIDTVGTTGTRLTQVRDESNPENPTADNPTGLREGFTGNGYLDMGADVGDAAIFSVDVPRDGVYHLTFRYANGDTKDRPMSFTINGVEAPVVSFPQGNSWSDWREVTVEVQLKAGNNDFKLANTIPNGPNIDHVRITADTSADEDNNLALAVVNQSNPASTLFEIEGADADIASYWVSIDNGPRQQVTPDAQWRFTLDMSSYAGRAVPVQLYVIDTSGNEAAAATAPTVGSGFSIQLEAEDFGIIDTVGTTGTRLTQVRDESNPENPTADNPTGLREGFTGNGYLDMGADVGDAAIFSVDVPRDGVYHLTFRYANGDTKDRPMSFTINGVEAPVVSFPQGNSWSDWREVTVEVQLKAGNNDFKLANTIPNGPNIDHVKIVEGPAPTPQMEVRINFQNGADPVVDGYLVDNFDGFGDRGNGFTYGWVTEKSVLDSDGTSNTPINRADYPANAIGERTGDAFEGYDPRLTGYARFDFGDNFPSGDGNRVAWEIKLENGWYEVTVAVGDTGGPNDSQNRLYIEGELAADFVPTDIYKTQLVTKLVKVTDGHLTLSAQDGVRTEIQYIDIKSLPDLTPGDNREAPADYPSFTQPRAVVQEGSEVIAVDLKPSSGIAEGVDPASDIFLGISVVQGRGGIDIGSLNNGSFRLFETLTGEEVLFTANGTAGSDSVTISPRTPLKPYTSYTLVAEGALDRGPNDDPNGAQREFQKLSTTFVTGAAREVEAREVAFEDTLMIDGAADGAFMFTTIEITDDAKHIYVSTLSGQIHRWDLDSEGAIIKSTQQTFTPGGDFNEAGGRRGIVGLVFDPVDPNVIWVSDNAPVPLTGKDSSVPDFSGRISKVTLGPDGSLENATIETYIRGLPRSNGDHVTNSVQFRPNVDYDPELNPDVPQYLMYVLQGSNTAMGEADSAWGFRPERLLTAAVLEIDPTRDAPPGGFDVTTEPLPADGTNRRFADNDNNLKNGGIPITSGEHKGNFLHFDERGVASVRTGESFDSQLIREYYNPYADDAVLKLYATGIRNAYDLVWHSNGYLYVPTNGSAAGGTVPNNPNTPENEGLTNVGLQPDFLFRVVKGGYYGHPNTLRDEFILNGGNPTGGVDPHEVTRYPVGTLPEPGFKPEDIYNLGNNRSPNGALEYSSDVFGTSLKGAVLFTEYSGGNDVRAVLLDANGRVISDFVLRDLQGNVINGYPDPLDIIHNPVTGQIYVMTLNRSNGQSQIIRLDPKPGAVIGDNTADEDGDLAIVAVDLSNPEAAIFKISGMDADIVTATVSFDGGKTVEPVPVRNGTVVLDLTKLQPGQQAVQLKVVDGVGNVAQATHVFNLMEPGSELRSLVIIQAEDNNPHDGTEVTLATGSGAQIVIRDVNNPEPNPTAPGLVAGLRPGAYGLDGNTDYSDGVPGGYADFGKTNADYITFHFDVAPGEAGSAILQIRYANGSSPTSANGGNRPLAVEVNGTLVMIAPFKPTSGSTENERWSTWEIQEIEALLVPGRNTVTLRSVNNDGPNVDQLEILIPADRGTAYAYYEAEDATLIGGPLVIPNSQDDRNAEGTGFVDYEGKNDQSILWDVPVSASGVYEIAIRYALPASKGARPLTLEVNGKAQSLPFEGFGDDSWTEWRYEIVQVELHAGNNQIKLTAPKAHGPNIDQLRVTTQPLNDGFIPEFNLVDEIERIELEQTENNGTRIVSSNTVEFYVQVTEDGYYALDVAANAGAKGGKLTFYVNGQKVGETAYPGAGDAGEKTVFAPLQAGQSYQIRIVSEGPGADQLDYLDVRTAPEMAPVAAIRGTDPVFFEDRLHFSWIDNNSRAAPNRDYKENGFVEIANNGKSPLEIKGHVLTGPFVLKDPGALNGLVLQPGEKMMVEVLFNRSAYTAGGNLDNGVFTGGLDILTNDPFKPSVHIELAGFWQRRDEGGWEPNLNEVWQVFGFKTHIDGLPYKDTITGHVLDNKDIYEKANELEVLSPYWRLADGVTEARITQIAAYHGDGGAPFGIHNPGARNQTVIIGNHADDNNQSILPINANGAFTTGTITGTKVPDGWRGNDIFGIHVHGYSSDPRLNPKGPGEVPEGTQRGHFVRFFQALDRDGKVIPNTYLVIQDYAGINFDYNDNMFVIQGVTPVGFGADLRISGLDPATADDRLVFTNIMNPDVRNPTQAIGGQEFKNETVITLTNDGFETLQISKFALEGPGASAFQIVNAPKSIAAGGKVDVTIRFVGVDPVHDNKAVAFDAALRIESNAYTQSKVINLAGIAQNQSEKGQEPTVTQIVEAFGFTTDMAEDKLANGGKVEAVGDEVLMPYLKRLDSSRPIEVIQIAAFLQQNDIARVSIHDVKSSALTELFAQDDQQGQTVLPEGLVKGNGSTGSVARATIDRDEPFGLYIAVDGRPTYASWSDPIANRLDPDFGHTVPQDGGHLVRFFQARDAQGEVIPGTYIVIQDYPGGANYDYNDTMLVITNVAPHKFSRMEDYNRDGINDALMADDNEDGIPDFFAAGKGPAQTAFNDTKTPWLVGDDGLLLFGAQFDNGGQGVAYNDLDGPKGSGLRGPDVDIIENSQTIGWISNGEWVEYTINVAEAGTYAISFQAALGAAGGATRSITASFANGDTPYEQVTVTTPRTGSWNNYVQTDAAEVELQAGTQILRVAFNGGSQNFASFQINPISAGAGAMSISGFAMEPFAEGTSSSDSFAEDDTSDMAFMQDDGLVFGFDDSLV